MMTHGILTEEVQMYRHCESKEILLPKLIVKLRQDKEYYFEIYMEMTGQMF